MSGLWLERGELRLRSDLRVPRPTEGEALVAVRRAGICGTDRAMLRGYAEYTGIPGHEFVGVVRAGPPELLGERVVGDINVGCGGCPACADGEANHCAARRVLGIRGLGGAFAELLVLPAANLTRVPDEISDELAAFAEPYAAALRICEQVEVAGRHALVIGDGCLGQLVARALLDADAEVTVVGRHAAKLRRLADLPIATMLDPPTVRRDFDLAVECSGNPSGLATALAGVRPRGVVVMKSTFPGVVSLDPARLVVDEVSLVGSRCGSLPRALAALRDDRLGVAALLDAALPLARALEAFERAGDAETIKIHLTVP